MMITEYEIAINKGFSEDDLEDIKNIEDFKSGDMRAYGMIYKKYYNVVLRELTKLYEGNVEKAEDLTSDVMLKIMNTIEKYSVQKGSGYFGGWIRRVSKNAFLDKERLKSTKLSKNLIRIDNTVDSGEGKLSIVQIKENDYNVEENLISKELKNEMNFKINKVINKLSEEEKQVLYLRINCGLSFNDISEELGKSVNRCLSKFHRVKKKLQKEI